MIYFFRRPFENTAKNQSTSQPKNANTDITDFSSLNKHLLSKVPIDTEIKEQKEIVPLENALLNMNEALRTLTINAQTKVII